MDNNQIISNSQMHSNSINRKRQKRAFILSVLLISFVSFFSLIILLVSNQTLGATVTSTTKVLAQERPTAKTVTAGGTQQKNVAAKQNTVVTATVTKCTPSGLSTNAAIPLLNPSANGITDTGTKTSYYAVFGNTKSQIAGQIHACSPVVSSGTRYAASTDYVINWTFKFQGDDNDNCRITTANVGISIGKILPSWQSTPTTSTDTQVAWNAFITNLSRHEEGHASLDRQYASQILSTLQSLPSTSCTSIQAEANARAKAIIVQLDQANEQYDAVTQHGTTQGATL